MVLLDNNDMGKIGYNGKNRIHNLSIYVIVFIT